MKNVHIIATAFIGAGLIACAAVSAMAYNSATSQTAETVTVSQSQQDQLDALVEQL